MLTKLRAFQKLTVTNCSCSHFDLVELEITADGAVSRGWFELATEDWDECNDSPLVAAGSDNDSTLVAGLNTSVKKDREYLVAMSMSM